MSEKPVTKSVSNLMTLMLGAGLILLGILSLFGRFVNVVFNFDIGHYAWPFFIIFPGVLMFMASFTLERRAGVTLAVFGGMAFSAGVLLMVQNIFDLFASWAYAWALVAPTSIGLSKLVYGTLRGLGDEVSQGMKMAGIGFGMFIFGAFFFELVIGISGFRIGAAWYCWPAMLIGLGFVVLLTSLLPRQNQSSS